MAQAKKRITILDLAKAVGVTDGTVSRALTGDPRVKPETREKVIEAAKRLGYRPNLAARYFKQGQTRTLGVILEFGYWLFYNPYFGRLVAGLADAAREDDRRLTFFFPEIEPSKSNPGNDVVHPKGLDEVLDGRVDGAILVAGRKLSEEDLRRLKESPVPIVLLNTNQVVPGFFQVNSGASARTKAAALALIDQGHRRIGMLGLYPDNPYEWACLQGMIEAHEARNLDFSKDRIASIDHWDISQPDSVLPAVEKLLSQNVTGIICSDATQSVVALELLKRKGVLVPKDVSLTAFGPMPHGARMVTPEISMFNSDIIEAGRETYRLFKEALDDMPFRTYEMKWTLQKGETLGPPKS
jgi:LacI family transcriptional regulator